MENIDNLQMLLKQRDELETLVRQNKEEVKTTLLNFLTEHCLKGDVELGLRINFNNTWACSPDESGRWYVYVEVKFYTNDAKRLAEGYEFDFHSSFDLRIYEKRGIELSCPTSGGYYSTDKYQVARAHLISSIWDNEDAILNLIKRTFRFDSYLQFNDVKYQISKIEDQLKAQKERDAYDEIVKALKGGKYLANRSSKSRYGETEDGHTDWDKELGTDFHFYNIEKIEKVTEKTVKTVDSNYHWVNHYYKLAQIVSNIRYGQLFIFDEVPQDYFEAKTQEVGA